MWLGLTHSALFHYPMAWFVLGLVIGFVFGVVVMLLRNAGSNHGV